MHQAGNLAGVRQKVFEGLRLRTTTPEQASLLASQEGVDLSPEQLDPGLKQRQTFELEGLRHKNELEQIAAQGDQSRRTQAASATMKAAGGTPATSPYAQERAGRTVQSVDQLLGRVNRWTTGAGSMLSALPETDARNFKAELDTLKANIVFNELAQMREASKTGGALGAVSERELALLESTLGALDQGQSPDNLKRQLAQVKESVQRWQAAQAGPPAVNTNVVGQEFDWVNGQLVPRGAR